jgi:hypothetical protein
MCLFPFGFVLAKGKLLLCIPTRDVRRFKMGMSAKYGFGYCNAEVEK